MKFSKKLTFIVTVAAMLMLTIVPVNTAFACQANPDDPQRIYESNGTTGVITDAGDLYMWGYNCYGQVGDGTKEDRKFPYKVLSNVKSFATGNGDGSTMAITKSGDLYGWGQNYTNCLGVEGGPILKPTKIMSDVKQVAMGWTFELILKTNGELYGLGRTYEGQLDVVGKKDTYADSIVYRTKPVRLLSGHKVKAVSAGHEFSAAITEDNSLYIWGNNHFGQRGDGTGCENRDDYHAEPFKALTSVASVSCGQDTVAAVTTNGELWTWGSDQSYQTGLDLGPEIRLQNTPKLCMTNVKKACMSGTTGAALTKDNKLYFWGKAYYALFPDCSEYDVDYKTVPECVATDVEDFEIENNHVFYIKGNKLYAWGENSLGTMGDNTTTNVSSPKVVFDLTSGKAIYAPAPPAAPSKATISSLTNTSSGITVKWGKITGATGYYIYRSKDGGAYSKVKTITSKSTVSWTDTKATTNGSKYSYKVVTYKSGEGGTTKSSASAIKKTYRLSKPKTPTLKALTGKKIKVSWTTNSKASGYKIQYSTSSTFASSKTITVTSKTTASKTISKLTAGKRYYVRIRAYKTVSGVKYYSAWSTKKYTTAKK